MSILLVEDDPADAKHARTVFARLDLDQHVVVAEDAESALRLLSGDSELPPLKPAFILLDLGLPDMDGLSLLERLQDNETTRDIPVFILTGTDDDRLLLQSYRLGASDYIVKPLSIKKTTSALKKVGLRWDVTRRTMRLENDAAGKPSNGTRIHHVDT